MIGRPLVLVVDDADDLRALAVEVLAGSGIEAVGLGSGVEAIEWLEQADRLPDAVVLDVQMPEMDGWTTLERLRSRPRLEGIAVILCTVRSRSEDRERGASVGADRYLPKPFSIARLEQMVWGVLKADCVFGNS